MARCQVRTSMLEVNGGLLMGSVEEPSGWGYAATGTGYGVGGRFRSPEAAVPLEVNFNYGTFIGRQQALKDIFYRNQPMFTVQRYGMSYADVALQTLAGSAYWTPFINREKYSFQLKVGLEARRYATSWLHPVTTTRVNVNRNMLAPTIGIMRAPLNGNGPHNAGFGWGGWLDLAIAQLTSASRQTNEGLTQTEQALRINGFGPAQVGLEGRYYTSGPFGFGLNAVFDLWNIGSDFKKQNAQVRVEAALVIQLFYGKPEPVQPTQEEGQE